MEKVGQFTYSYTNYKAKQFGIYPGDGVFNITKDYNIAAKEVILGVRQDFPDTNYNRFSFGYIHHESNPLIFKSFVRTDEYVITDRGGPEPYYGVHVSVGKPLFNNCYAIEYYGGNLKNTTDDGLDDSQRPELYEELTKEDIEDGRNSDFSFESVNEKICDNLSELSVLLDAVINALKQNKKVFLCTDYLDNDVVAEWMSMVLMMLPRSIANKISFCTYAPAPTRGKYIICGVDKETTPNYTELSNYGYVFNVGISAISDNYFPNNESSICSLFSMCDRDTYFEWLSFLEEFSKGRDITIDDFLFAVDIFRMKIDRDLDVRQKIQKLNRCYNNPHNYNKIAQKLFVLLCEDAAVLNQLNEDQTLAYSYVEGLKGIICDATTPQNLVDEYLDISFYFMLQNTSAHYIFGKIIDQSCSLNSFYGGRAVSAEKKLISSAETVKEALSNDFYVPEGNVIESKILICLINIFLVGAFRKEGIEREVLNLCSAKLIVQNGLEHLLQALRSVNESRYVSLARFLLELKNEDSALMIEEDNYYRDRLFHELTSNRQNYRKIVDSYLNSKAPDANLYKYLLKYNWKTANVSFDELVEMFEERDNFRSIGSYFDRNYIEVFNANIEAALEREQRAVTSLPLSHREQIKSKFENAISMFEIFNGNPEICSFASRIKPFRDIIREAISTGRRTDESKTMRVNYVKSKIYQIPKKSIIKLFQKYNIIVGNASDEFEFMEDAATEAARFLNRETSQISKETKINFCNELDKLVEKYRAQYANTKTITDMIINTVTAILLMLAFAGLTSIVGEILSYQLCMGYGSLIKGLFPIIGIIFSGTMFFSNKIIEHQRTKRVILSVFETICLLIVMFAAYYSIVLLL